MMNIKRAVMALGAALAVFLVTIGVGATPAQASSVYGCGDRWICFYNYTNWNSAGGSWGIRIYNDGVHSYAWNRCITMPTSGTSFTNGTAYNAATSILVNNSGTNTLESYARFYDGNDCDPAELMLTIGTDPNTLNLNFPNLSNVAAFPSGGGTVNDRIGSFKINSEY
jgi:hypothetical protein